MSQRRINMSVFGFLGVILGIMLAAVANYGGTGAVIFAMTASGLLGALIGANWTPTPVQRRPRITSK